MERGMLIEERAQLELKLTQEQYYCENLPQRRNLAIWGIALEVLVAIFLLAIIVVVARGWFGIVVAPVLFVFLIIWLVWGIKRIKPDIAIIKKTSFDMEISKSMIRQEELKEKINDLQKKIQEIPVSKWIS